MIIYIYKKSFVYLLYIKIIEQQNLSRKSHPSWNLSIWSRVTTCHDAIFQLVIKWFVPRTVHDNIRN